MLSTSVATTWPVTAWSSAVVIVAVWATGASFTGLTVKLTVVTADEAPLESVTRKVKLSVPL